MPKLLHNPKPLVEELGSVIGVEMADARDILYQQHIDFPKQTGARTQLSSNLLTETDERAFIEKERIFLVKRNYGRIQAYTGARGIIRKLQYRFETLSDDV